MPEEGILGWLARALTDQGPIVLFVACMLETAVFAGLIIPVGGLIGFSAMLATRGVISYQVLIGVALGGAFLGDQIGYAFGHYFSRIDHPQGGRVAKVWRTSLRYAEALLKARGSIGISLSRGIPFVRTIMPWLAGRSKIRYLRFLIFDAFGLVIWATLYIGGGVVAGQGWQQAAREFGEVAGAIVGVALLALLVWFSGGIVRRMHQSRSDL